MAVANNWNDALKILYFQSFLQGAANLWYTEYKEGHPDSNWPLICQAFKKEFDDDNCSLRLLAKVRERTQDPLEPTRKYFYDLRVRYEEYKRDIDFGEFQEIFQNGLTTEAKARYYWLIHFPNQPPRSLEEIKLLCVTTPPQNYPHGPLHPRSSHNGGHTITQTLGNRHGTKPAALPRVTETHPHSAHSDKHTIIPAWQGQYDTKPSALSRGKEPRHLPEGNMTQGAPPRPKTLLQHKGTR